MLTILVAAIIDPKSTSECQPRCSRWEPSVRWSVHLFAMSVIIIAPVFAQLELPRKMSRRQAIDLALAVDSGNIQFRESLEQLLRERARRRQTRSSLLPQLSAEVRQSSQTTNLEALGLRPQGLFRPPSLVGPFSTFDARVRMTQTLFSTSALRSIRSSDRAIARQEEEGRHTQERIASQVSRLYLSALRLKSQLEAAQARLRLAQKLFALVQRQRASGLGTAIEETRANLEVARARQNLQNRQFESQTAFRQLAHFLSLDLDQELDLTDRMDDVSPLEWTYPMAIQRAIEGRKDIRALEAAILEARSRLGAVRATRLPELHGFAEYGTIGSAASNTIPTWAVGAQLDIPIFRGGRTGAQAAELRSLLRSRQLAADELRREIELDTRVELARLHLTASQLGVGEEARRLAEDEVARAERRYRAGVSTNLEVIEAQTHLTQAIDELITAHYHHQLARISFAETLGILLTELP